MGIVSAVTYITVLNQLIPTWDLSRTNHQNTLKDIKNGHDLKYRTHSLLMTSFSRRNLQSAIYYLVLTSSIISVVAIPALIFPSFLEKLLSNCRSKITQSSELRTDFKSELLGIKKIKCVERQLNFSIIYYPIFATIMLKYSHFEKWCSILSKITQYCSNYQANQ